MASATHLIPTSPLSVMVPNPRRGICRPLLRVTSGTKFFWVLVFGAANDCALPRLRNIAEAAHPALVCKNWRRLIPLELRSLFILVDIPHIVSSPRPARLCLRLPFSLSLNQPSFLHLAHDLMAPAFEMDSKPAPFSNHSSYCGRLVSYGCCSRCRIAASGL